ncbi:MAG: polysaccharide deacetylase family protein [Myxococcales bacterium]|nr:polysaccharide deacetylase family protein [Myxococcales bacterium]
MLRVQTPTSHSAARRYVAEVVLHDMLGLEVQVETAPTTTTRLSLDGRELTIADGLFTHGDDRWLEPNSLPTEPLPRWNPEEVSELTGRVEAPVPVLYGTSLEDGRYLKHAGERIEVGIDLFGSIFFMLTRYEEAAAGADARDERDRFPASSSIAKRASFLDRPLVDEYVELLWALMQRLWPSLRRKPRSYRLRLSHDVDMPYQRRVGYRETLRLAKRDALEQGDLVLALKRGVGYPQPLGHVSRLEPNNTFAWMMDESERRSLQSAFYFMARRSPDPLDADYGLDDRFIRRLMAEMHARGHELGLHPSYDTYEDPARLASERRALSRCVERLGIEQPRWGGRQHYLRWSNPATWQGWADASLDYDSSLGFHDRVGFRSGTCFEHRVFNLRTRSPLSLTERPLIAMDQTLRGYMALGPGPIVEKVRALAVACRRVGGEMTLLWHNSSLITGAERRLYREVLDACGA